MSAGGSSLGIESKLSICHEAGRKAAQDARSGRSIVNQVGPPATSWGPSIAATPGDHRQNAKPCLAQPCARPPLREKYQAVSSARASAPLLDLHDLRSVSRTD